jgi:Zn-dependent protease
MLDSAWVVQAVTNLILLVLSLTVHEFAHAWMAWRLGDDTAARAGRLTLNPLPHIDPFGTILLPLVGAPIGWAKPTPVDVSRVRRGIRTSTADILISAAGPVSNLLFAVVGSVVYGCLARFAPGTLEAPGVVILLERLMLVNASLCVFNLLPIPPLDGGHVVGHFVPYRWRGTWESFARYAPLLLLAVLMLGRGIPGLYLPIQFLYGAVRQIAVAIA